MPPTIPIKNQKESGRRKGVVSGERGNEPVKIYRETALVEQYDLGLRQVITQNEF